MVKGRGADGNWYALYLFDPQEQHITEGTLALYVLGSPMSLGRSVCSAFMILLLSQGFTTFFQ